MSSTDVANYLCSTQINEFENMLADHNVEFDASSNDHLSRAISSPTDIFMAAMTGMVSSFHTEQSLSGWIDLKGGEFDRTTDALLWEYAQAGGLVVDQATKDGDAMTYAIYFGDGDGETTFTVPNHHLGHFIRGNTDDIALGTTQGDAIRNIEGRIRFTSYANNEVVEGVFNSTSTTYSSTSNNSYDGDSTDPTSIVYFDASTVVPTADENRPYTANLCIKMFRGYLG